MTLFSSVVMLGGVAVWGLMRGSGYEAWYAIVLPSLLMCRERLVTLQSTGDSRLKHTQESSHEVFCELTQRQFVCLSLK